MVPELYAAWHAGVSNWKNLKSLNKYSIGIEVHNKGHEHGYHKFNKAQINSIISLCKKLIKKYKIQSRNILAHSDISYNRKKDPGEKFPWELLSKNNIGNWHNFDKNILKKSRKVKISSAEKKKNIKSLKKIGYLIKKNNFEFKQLIKNFQRRYRPELIDGKLDKESLIIAKKISQL